MDLGAIILLILVFGFILLFVTRPFFEQPRIHAAGKNTELSSLLAEHENLLAAIQELDSDFALEKIPLADYPAQRTELLHKGADVLRQLDALTSLSPKATAGQTGSSPENASPAFSTLTDDELEDLLARRRSVRREKNAGFCPKCGQPVLFSDAFCPSCGHELK